MTQRREPNAPARAPYPLRVALAVWIVAEAAAFIGLAYLVGVVYTLLIFFGTSLLGAALIWRVGAKSFRAARDYLNSGGDPTRETPNGYAVAGAVCLCIPGFVTDLLGLLLLFPPTRLLFRGLGRYLAARTPTMRFGGGGDVIEGEVLDERDADPKPDPGRGGGPRPIE
ncbi:FxsA family protein [Glycomyces arizonensis]|uniref:FxsA family protein n=1 Tax=Glycomyces arizonensis TaxID=256035 RepID=UPI0003FC2ECD|nr:FxsA family protein [Glycomyces arizonensis]